MGKLRTPARLRPDHDRRKRPPRGTTPRAQHAHAKPLRAPRRRFLARGRGQRVICQPPLRRWQRRKPFARHGAKVVRACVCERWWWGHQAARSGAGTGGAPLLLSFVPTSPRVLLHPSNRRSNACSFSTLSPYRAHCRQDRRCVGRTSTRSGWHPPSPPAQHAHSSPHQHSCRHSRSTGTSTVVQFTQLAAKAHPGVPLQSNFAWTLGGKLTGDLEEDQRRYTQAKRDAGARWLMDG